MGIIAIGIWYLSVGANPDLDLDSISFPGLVLKSSAIALKPRGGGGHSNVKGGIRVIQKFT